MQYASLMQLCPLALVISTSLWSRPRRRNVCVLNVLLLCFGGFIAHLLCIAFSIHLDFTFPAPFPLCPSCLLRHRQDTDAPASAVYRVTLLHIVWVFPQWAAVAPSLLIFFDHIVVNVSVWISIEYSVISSVYHINVALLRT